MVSTTLSVDSRWKSSITIGLLLISLQLFLVRAEIYPNCDCHSENCTTVSLTNHGSTTYSSQNTTMSLPTVFYCNSSRNIMCCTEKNETHHSGCKIEPQPETVSECRVVDDTCVNSTTTLPLALCNETYVYNNSCVTSCPCGYEQNSSKCVAISMPTTSVDQTTSAFSNTTTTPTKDPCNKLLFKIYEVTGDGKCIPFIPNFYLLVVITLVGAVLIMVIIFVVCCKRCRRRNPEVTNSPPGKEELGGKGSSRFLRSPLKNLSKRRPTELNDYKRSKGTVQGVHVSPADDYGVVDSTHPLQPLQPLQPIQPQPDDQYLENYENVELQDPATQEVYENVSTPPTVDEQEIYENNEVVSPRRPTESEMQSPGNRESQQVYLPMDGSNQQPSYLPMTENSPATTSDTNQTGHGYTNAPVARGLQHTIKLLQAAANYNKSPAVAERESCEEEYTYAGTMDQLVGNDDQQAYDDRQAYDDQQQAYDDQQQAYDDQQQAYDDVGQQNNYSDCEENIYQNVQDARR